MDQPHSMTAHEWKLLLLGVSPSPSETLPTPRLDSWYVEMDLKRLCIFNLEDSIQQKC